MIKEDSNYLASTHIQTGKHTLIHMHTQTYNIHIYRTNKKIAQEGKKGKRESMVLK